MPCNIDYNELNKIKQYQLTLNKKVSKIAVLNNVFNTDFIITEKGIIANTYLILYEGMGIKNGKLTLPWYKINGNFAVSDLTTLDNMPEIVLGEFAIINSFITTLENSPRIVTGKYTVTNTCLKSLKGICKYANELDISDTKVNSFLYLNNADSINITCTKIKTTYGLPRTIHISTIICDNDIEILIKNIPLYKRHVLTENYRTIENSGNVHTYNLYSKEYRKLYNILEI